LRACISSACGFTTSGRLVAVQTPFVIGSRNKTKMIQRMPISHEPEPMKIQVWKRCRTTRGRRALNLRQIYGQVILVSGYLAINP